MNNKVEIKKSDNDGKGVFATDNIKKGDIIIKRNGFIVPSLFLKLSPGYIKERVFPVNSYSHMLPTKPAKYVNHSCDPNWVKRKYD